MAAYGTETLRFIEGGRTFDFTLNRKREDFDGVEVDYFWIPTIRMKPSKNPDASDFRSICDSFRAIWAASGETEWTGPAGKHLMARLAPRVPVKGRQSIFADAKERPSVHYQSIDVELDEMLRATREPLRRMPENEFQKEMFKIQGSARDELADYILYERMEKDLLQDACERWRESPEEAVRSLEGRLDVLVRKYVKRGDSSREKKILNTLSYEAWAAFRLCHSQVWYSWILPKLQADFGISRHSYRFMKYWHQMIQRESNESPNDYFTVLPGHCFGLHPAARRLLNTPRGRELIGAWLRAAESADAGLSDAELGGFHEPQDLPEYELFLNAFHLAYYHYDGCRERVNQDHPKNPRPRTRDPIRRRADKKVEP
jgi:hypothetical protein